MDFGFDLLSKITYLSVERLSHISNDSRTTSMLLQWLTKGHPY